MIRGVIKTILFSSEKNPTCLNKHKRYRHAEEVLQNERLQHLR
jgi:hypothetical protein